MSETSVFKICPMCSTQWETLDDFLNDKSLEINGYQADFQKLEDSFFYFTHNVEGCGTTMTIYAEKFFSLYAGKRYPQRKTGEKDCPGFCLDDKQLERCEAFCECAFNREILRIIKERHID